MNTQNGHVLNVFGRVNFILDKVQKDIQGDIQQTDENMVLSVEIVIEREYKNL